MHGGILMGEGSVQDRCVRAPLVNADRPLALGSYVRPCR